MTIVKSPMAYHRHVADELPLIDVAPLLAPDGDPSEVARRIDDACRGVGFFRITGHGVPPAQLAALDRLARRFFAAPEGVKAEIAMAHGGSAWRGWFPLDGELTSGRPDHKEGLYFGTELPADHPAVAAGRPLHGANLFPATVPELRPAVLGWIDAMAALGAALLRGDGHRARSRRRLVRPPRHRRPDRAVPDLPLSARSRPGGDGAGASPSTPTTAC